jgi:hypothetical protein
MLSKEPLDLSAVESDAPLTDAYGGNMAPLDKLVHAGSGDAEVLDCLRHPHPLSSLLLHRRSLRALVTK